MNRPIRGLFALLFCFAAAMASAQTTLNTDLSLSVNISPSTHLAPGQVGTITLMFRNNGPTAVSPAVARGFATPEVIFAPSEELGTAQFILTEPPQPGTCNTNSEALDTLPLTTYLLGFGVGPLGAGESAVCTLGIEAGPAAEGSTRLTFELRDLRSEFFSDLDNSNNSTLLALTFGPPRPQPIPLGSVASWFLLSAALGLLAARRFAGKRVGW